MRCPSARPTDQQPGRVHLLRWGIKRASACWPAASGPCPPLAHCRLNKPATEGGDGGEWGEIGRGECQKRLNMTMDVVRFNWGGVGGEREREGERVGRQAYVCGA
jgi:hypothetical protein